LIISGSPLSLGYSLNQFDLFTDPISCAVTLAANVLHDPPEHLDLVMALVGQAKTAWFRNYYIPEESKVLYRSKDGKKQNYV
jgi:hypothetical protein